jgi:hypothetical protein
MDKGKQMKITLDQLKKLKACAGQVALFKELFGSGVELTEALVLEHGSQFDLDWLAERLFKGDILAEYWKARKPIWVEYWKAHEPILAEYLKARKSIRAKRQKPLELIETKYWKARKLIEVRRWKDFTIAFWACVLKMEE